MKRLAGFFLLGLLTACGTSMPRVKLADAVRPAGTTPEHLPGGAVCRVGADGAAVVADRGIGGTGAPDTQLVADRGIGGTGIVGIITGFASICVNGLEVQLDAALLADIDGIAMPASALRAGQVVVIQAQGSRAALRAEKVSIRREVAGRIEAIALDAGLLTIAGQTVSVSAATWGAERFQVGNWVAVSGLRRPDGVVVASRLDTSPEDRFSVRGAVVRDGAAMRVGGLVLDGPGVTDLSPGQFVAVSGRYVAGQARITAVTDDTLFSNPSAFFGPAVDNMIIQAFVQPENGGVRVNGVLTKAAQSVRARIGQDLIAVVSLDRASDKPFAVANMDYAGNPTLSVPPAGDRLPQPLHGKPSPKPTAAPTDAMPDMPPAGEPIALTSGKSIDAQPLTPLRAQPASPIEAPGPCVVRLPATMPVAPDPLPLPAGNSDVTTKSELPGAVVPASPSTSDLMSSNTPSRHRLTYAMRKALSAGGVMRRASNTVNSGMQHGSAPIISLADEAPSPAANPPAVPACSTTSDGSVVVTSAPASSAKAVEVRKVDGGPNGKVSPNVQGQPTAD